MFYLQLTEGKKVYILMDFKLANFTPKYKRNFSDLLHSAGLKIDLA